MECAYSNTVCEILALLLKLLESLTSVEICLIGYVTVDLEVLDNSKLVIIFV